MALVRAVVVACVGGALPRYPTVGLREAARALAIWLAARRRRCRWVARLAAGVGGRIRVSGPLFVRVGKALVEMLCALAARAERLHARAEALASGEAVARARAARALAIDLGASGRWFASRRLVVSDLRADIWSG